MVAGLQPHLPAEMSISYSQGKKPELFALEASNSLNYSFNADGKWAFVT